MQNSIDVTNNLYENEISEEELKKQLDEIKECRSVDKINKLINTYENNKFYRVDRENKEVVAYVNGIFEKNSHYLDSNLKKFKNDFPSSYRQRIWELVIADFINNKNGFILSERQNVNDDNKKSSGENYVDLIFSYRDKKYYLECTCRISNYIQKWIEDLDKFNSYCRVAQIFYDANKDYKEKYKSCEEWYYNSLCARNIFLCLSLEKKSEIIGILGLHQCISVHKNNDWVKIYDFIGIKSCKVDIWSDFSLEKKCEIVKKLSLDECIIAPDEKDLEKFYEWVSLQRYALFSLKEFLPDDKMQKLSSDLGLKGQGFDLKGMITFYKFLAKLLAQAIFSKIEKNYFLAGVPVILAVSLALNNDSRMIANPLELIKEIIKYLPDALKNVYKAKKDECMIGFKNLYAVVLNTCLYDWHLPDLEESFCAKNKNYYYVLYNKNISENIREKSDSQIFSEFEVTESDFSF